MTAPGGSASSAPSAAASASHRSAEQRRTGNGEHHGAREQGALRTDQRDRHQRGQESAQQAADGRDRIEPPGDGPRGLDPLQPEPDREGRHHPEQDDRRSEQDQHAEERADRRTGGHLVEPFDREVEEGPGDERDHGDEHRRRDHQPAEDARVRPAVGEPPAQPVAERERGQDEADHVRPDDRRVAEVRSQQPRSGDFGRERSDPGHEDERGQTAERDGCGRS